MRKKLGALFEPISKSIGAKLAPAGRKLAAFGIGAKKALVGAGKAAAEDLGSVLPSLSTVLGVTASGAAAAAAAIAALAVGAGVAAGAIAAFGIGSAAAASKMQLQRQALLGNAKDAEALGEQIGALAGKVPQGVSELNELSRELSKTRLSGKAIVDTMAAVAQATGAVDASAGAKIQELVTRGQQSGRFYLNQLELQGTGLDFDDVARSYAEGTKKSVEAARAELARGEVPIESAAAALKKATEKKFGDINLKNAFSLENGPKKLKEQLGILSSGVDLGPISKALQDAFGQLDENAPLGRAVKSFMTDFGGGLVDVASKSIPLLLEGFKWMLVWGLRLQEQYYLTKKAVLDAFAKENWVGAGVEIWKGLLLGIFKGNTVLLNGAKDLATGIKKAFTGELDIHSPSKVFEGYGRNTVEGYAQGVQRGSRRADDAVREMGGGLPAPGGGARGGAGAAPASISVEVNIHGASTESAKGMQSPEFLSLLTRAIRDAVTTEAAGVAA